MDFKCEPDEFAKLVAEFKAAAIIADNRKGLFVQKNTFLGSQLVMYLTSVKHLSRLLIPLEFRTILVMMDKFLNDLSLSFTQLVHKKWLIQACISTAPSHKTNSSFLIFSCRNGIPSGLFLFLETYLKSHIYVGSDMNDKLRLYNMQWSGVPNFSKEK